MKNPDVISGKILSSYKRLSLAKTSQNYNMILNYVASMTELGCVVRMVVDSILLHAEYGPNDHRKDAPPFIRRSITSV